MMLNELAKEAYEIAKSKGWHDREIVFSDCIANIHCELSEAFEEYRKGYGMTSVRTYGIEPQGIPIELADVLIRVLNTCAMYGIDIDHAVRWKMDYNKTRPYRYGGKII